MISRAIKVALIGLATFGCAEVGPPPGGPEDKQGPVVLMSVPSNGAVNQSAIRSIKIELSEPISVPKGNAVFISPRPERLPRIIWTNRGIEIELADTLPSNHTYIVSLPAAMADLRGNKPDSAITLAFSTGSSLDSGLVSGRVFTGEKPAAGVSVALYDEKALKQGIVYDSIFPDYLTVTGNTGGFVFKHLPPATFRLIAFQKTGKDDRFRPLRDKFGIPDRTITVGDQPAITDINLALTSQDTTPVRIIGGSVTNDRFIQLRLSRPIDRELIQSTIGRVFVSVGGNEYPAIALAPSDSDNVAMIAAYFGPVPAGIGSLRWLPDTSRPSLQFDSLRIPQYADTTPPILTGIAPGDKPVLSPDTSVHLRFSEPLDTTMLTDTSVFLASAKDSSRLQSKRTSAGPFELVLTSDSLKAGESYEIILHESEIHDLAGNAVGDSIRRFYFSIINPDSLGWIEGTVRTSKVDSTSEISLTFRKLSDNQLFKFVIANRTFKFALPAGKYLVTGFVDRNSNGRFDSGLIFPHTLSEPFLPYSDTVSVRARFETAGIELEFK